MLRTRSHILNSIHGRGLVAAAVVGISMVAAGCNNGSAARASDTQGRGASTVPSAKARHSDAPATPQILSDFDIGTAVEHELGAQRGLPFDAIHVNVQDGVVSLSGTVDNFSQVTRAAQRAELVRGVTSVINRLEVSESGMRDWDIQSAVAEALRDDPATSSQAPAVVVEDGVVTLRGQVDSWARRDLAQQIAGDVRGVRGVRDELSVAPGRAVSDEDLQAEIRERLHDDVRVADDQLDVRVDKGDVIVSGTVASAAERTRVFDDARIAGAKAVDVSHLDAVWWKRNPMRVPADATTERGQNHIAEVLRKTMADDPRLLGFAPEVTVDDGTAVLHGDSPSLRAKRAAVEDALDTLGVWRVDDLLAVRPVPGLADGEIEARLQQAMNRSADLSTASIRVFVDHGVASLEGLVDDDFEKARAESVAANVAGVVRVDNHVQVQSPVQPLADWELQKDIERELAWNPYVERKAVKVDVREGVARLTGTVGDWRAYQEAQRSAKEGGARSVVNHLAVREGPPFLSPDVVGSVDSAPLANY